MWTVGIADSIVGIPGSAVGILGGTVGIVRIISGTAPEGIAGSIVRIAVNTVGNTWQHGRGTW